MRMLYRLSDVHRRSDDFSATDACSAGTAQDCPRIAFAAAGCEKDL